MSSAKLTTMTTMVATLFFAKAAFAGGPAVALVEEVTGAPGVEFMDYVEAGKVIPLKPQRLYRAELSVFLRARNDYRRRYHGR